MAQLSHESCRYALGQRQYVPWDTEEDLLIRYDSDVEGVPADCYSVRVTDFRQCSSLDTVELGHRRAQVTRHGNGGMASVSHTYPLFLGYWLSSPANIRLLDKGQYEDFASDDHDIGKYEGLATASEVHASWGYHGDVEDVQVFALPFPVAFGVMRGVFRKLILRTVWHNTLNIVSRRISDAPSLIPNWPPHNSAPWAVNFSRTWEVISTD